MSAHLREYFKVWSLLSTYDTRAASTVPLIPLSHVLDDCEANDKRLATLEEVEAFLGYGLEGLEFSEEYIIVVKQRLQGVDLYAAYIRACCERRPTLFRVGGFSGTEVMLPSAAEYIVCEKKDKQGNPLPIPAFP